MLDESPARAHVGGLTANFADIGERVNDRLPVGHEYSIRPVLTPVLAVGHEYSIRPVLTPVLTVTDVVGRDDRRLMSTLIREVLPSERTEATPEAPAT